MNILLALIPISLLLLVAAIWAFLAAVRGGQFDDLDTPALDMLREDDKPAPARSRQRDTAEPAQGDKPADEAAPR